MLAHRRYFMAALVGVTGAVALVGYERVSAPPIETPCDDALGALRVFEPTCTNRLTYEKGYGYVLKCIGGDVVISDVIASRDGNFSSFLFTSNRTMQQGICDCEKPTGLACEMLP